MASGHDLGNQLEPIVIEVHIGQLTSGYARDLALHRYSPVPLYIWHHLMIVEVTINGERKSCTG